MNQVEETFLTNNSDTKTAVKRRAIPSFFVNTMVKNALQRILLNQKI